MMPSLDSCRRTALTLASLLLGVGSLGAAPGVPAPLKSIPAIVPDAQATPPMSKALARDLAWQHVKGLGVSDEELAAVFGAIDAAAAENVVPADAIHSAAQTLADGDIAQKAEHVLTQYAEVATYGWTVDAPYQVNGYDGAELGAPKPIKTIPAFRGDSFASGPITPKLGGTCRACPSFDFGPFTPTAAFQTHSSSTSSGGDCNWYRFAVTPGTKYQFATCAPGSASFDTVIEVYNGSSCAFQISNDDACGGVTSDVTACAAAGQMFMNVKVRGYGSTDSGNYTLAYRSVGPCVSCSTCASPALTLANPTATCQFQAGSTSLTCPSTFYAVNLVGSQTYVFTFCNTTCPGATANYDTRMKLYQPACGAATLNNDDFCGLASQLTYTAPASGTYRIEATGFSATRVGNYTLGYRRTSAGGCATCATGPYLNGLTPLNPTASCQCTSGAVSSCQDNWYTVNLTTGQTYEFSTCTIPGGCAGTGSFDTVIDLHAPGCAALPIASDDDGCGAPLSRLTYLNTGVSGTYKIHVRGRANATGTYTMCYRLAPVAACVAPAASTLTPTTGSTNSANCSRTETFTTTADGTRPTTFTWSVTPPSGGSAAPPSGSVTSSTGTATFNSTLTASCAGNTFTVRVTARNACGSKVTTVTYTLRDTTAPRVTAPASRTVSCDAVPPAGTPTRSDNCDPSPALTFSEVTTPGSCPGNYVITRTWTARDCYGNVSTPAVQVVTVRDTTAPVITPDTSVKYCIHPPNHNLVCFTQAQFSPSITDNCSNPTTWTFVAVSNSEAQADPCGSGNQNPDIVVDPGGQGFCVRAERCGQDPLQNDGREYTVFGTATDSCGNTSAPTPIGKILVPHDTADTSGCIYPTAP